MALCSTLASFCGQVSVLRAGLRGSCVGLPRSRAVVASRAGVGGWVPWRARAVLPFHPPPPAQRASQCLCQDSTLQAAARVSHQLCTNAQGDKVHSPLASWHWGPLPRCKVGTGWALHCPLGNKNLKHMGSCWVLWKAGRLPHCGEHVFRGLGTLLAQELRGLDASPGPTCFGVCQISNYLIILDAYSYYTHMIYVIVFTCISIHKTHAITYIRMFLLHT